MSVFVVILPEENSEVVARMESKYPNPREISKTTFALATDDSSAQIADKLGLKGENRISPGGGVVFKLSGVYAGRADPLVWEWLEGMEANF